MKTFQIQKMPLTLLTFNKIQIKELPLKTRAASIITKNIQKLKILLNIRFLDLMIFKRLKLLKELAKYQANIQIGITLRT